MLTKDQFELKFRRHQDEGGYSYDEWDIEMCWRDYQKNPEKFDWLTS